MQRPLTLAHANPFAAALALACAGAPSRAAALALALVLASAPASATLVQGPADVASLTAASDAVVRARVERVESHWGAEGPAGGVMFTTALLTPTEWWKGAPEAQLLVRVPGGTQGEWVQEVLGAASFHAGEEVVVFLVRKASAGDRARARARGAADALKEGQPRPGLPAGGLDRLPDVAVYEVHLWALGKFALASTSPTSRVRAVRDRSGLLCRGCGADDHDDLALGDLRARVDAAVRAARPPGAP